MDDYMNQPCERCGSKKRVSRKWKEQIPTYTGSVEVEYSQIICTNAACQAAFDKNLLEETARREVIKQKKEANDVARKANSLTMANKARKSREQSL